MKNQMIEIAKKYHENTKHTFYSVRAPGPALDWENKPHPFKQYVDLEKIFLPRQFQKPTMDSLTAILGTKTQNISTKKEPLTLEKLASLLFFTDGIVRTKHFPGLQQTYYFRTAPATGALHSTELYIVTAEIEGLNAGIYHYNPFEFALTKLRDGDWRNILAYATDSDACLQTSTTLVFSALGWKNAWKYRERSYRHWFWDAGAMVANLFAVCNAFSYDFQLITAFIDPLINKLIGIDGEKEATLFLVPIHSEFKKEIQKPLNIKDFSKISPKTQPLSKYEIEYPEIYRMHGASCLNDKDELLEWKKHAQTTTSPWQIRPKREVMKVFPLKELVSTFKSTSPENPPLWETILRRGSTREFSHQEISLNSLATILTAAITPITTDFLNTSLNSLLELYLIVNAVENLPNGSYYFDKETISLELLKESSFRNVAGYLCLDQALGHDACVVFFLMTNLEWVLNKYGNRGYRLAQLEAGIRVGNIYLSSYALNIGATGLTFYDDAVTEFFSPHATQLSNMMTIAVGKPNYKANPGKIFPHLKKD